jgi:hypothetical protein
MWGKFSRSAAGLVDDLPVLADLAFPDDFAIFKVFGNGSHELVFGSLEVFFFTDVRPSASHFYTCRLAAGFVVCPVSTYDIRN